MVEVGSKEFHQVEGIPPSRWFDSVKQDLNKIQRGNSVPWRKLHSIGSNGRNDRDRLGLYRGVVHRKKKEEGSYK